MDIPKQLIHILMREKIPFLRAKSFEELQGGVDVKGKLLFIDKESKELDCEVQAISDGAIGIIWWPVNEATFNRAITAIRNQIWWFSRPAMSRYIDGVCKPKYARNTSRLTNREAEIASLVAQGMSNKEIAIEKDIAITTAKTHVQNLLRKLGVKNRTQLVGKINHWDLMSEKLSG